MKIHCFEQIALLARIYHNLRCTCRAHNNQHYRKTLLKRNIPKQLTLFHQHRNHHKSEYFRYFELLSRYVQLPNPYLSSRMDRTNHRVQDERKL